VFSFNTFHPLSSLHNTGASIAKSSFKTVPGVGLSLSASGVYVAFTGDWHYRKVHWYVFLHCALLS
jgi:hypothetical protein